VLRLHHAVEVIGQRSGQPQHVLVLAFGVPQDLDLGLQLQVHGPRAPAEALRDHLLGTLEGRGRGEERRGASPRLQWEALHGGPRLEAPCTPLGRGEETLL